MLHKNPVKAHIIIHFIWNTLLPANEYLKFLFDCIQVIQLCTIPIFWVIDI